MYWRVLGIFVIVLNLGYFCFLVVGFIKFCLFLRVIMLVVLIRGVFLWVVVFSDREISVLYFCGRIGFFLEYNVRCFFFF